MIDYVVAGAASIEDISCFLNVTRQAGITVILVENEAMWCQIPVRHRAWVVCSNEIPDAMAPLIPLNEFWVSRAIRAGVANISRHALQASRSKHYLSLRLSQCGVHALPRRYIEDIAAPGPLRYLARLDAGYSSYGIVRDIEAGHFDAQMIRRSVQSAASDTLRSVLDENRAKVVVEDRLEGEEYSADVFVGHGQVILLRLFRKTVVWINGSPVCDSYIAVHGDVSLHEAINDWCAALFSGSCISFGQFDFIVAGGRAVPVDFSCRIGGGLDAIKRFAGIPSYIAMALAGHQPCFPQFTVQKNLVARRSGRLAYIDWSAVDQGKVTVRKQAGDLLPENICSANARIAEICFAARSLEDALVTAAQLDERVTINVRD